MSAIATKADGTQAIRRAAAILRHIAQAPNTGLSLRDVSEAMNLTRSTAHRMLKCLVEERLVETVPPDRRYAIGALAFELGLAAGGRQNDIAAWRGAVEKLAAKTGATAYLMGRSGNEAVCLHKSEGASVVRVIPVDIGHRRPLGVGAGATALLAAIAEPEATRILAAIAPRLAPYAALTSDDIRKNLDQARKTGIAESQGKVAEGVYGLGRAIPNPHGPATLAISLAMHQSQATADRVSLCKSCLVKIVEEGPG